MSDTLPFPEPNPEWLRQATADLSRFQDNQEWLRVMGIMKMTVRGLYASKLSAREFLELWQYGCLEGRDPRRRPWYPKIKNLFEAGRETQDGWMLRSEIRGAIFSILLDTLPEL